MSSETTSSKPARTIAIDGPAASGKSVVGATVADRLVYRFFDTGAMYRAVTWYALERGIDPHNDRALAALADHARVEVQDLAQAAGDERTGVLVDGRDATPHLRTVSVEANVSLVSRVPAVRARMVRIQRELAAKGGVVMAGRDIGTVVLPAADLKVYLDASPRVRAERRAAQIRASGEPADVASLTADLERRDGIDSSRETSPLTAAKDAVIMHTDELTIDEVVERIVELAR
jgi:CMP/dCMP kinase